MVTWQKEGGTDLCSQALWRPHESRIGLSLTRIFVYSNNHITAVVVTDILCTHAVNRQEAVRSYIIDKYLEHSNKYRRHRDRTRWTMRQLAAVVSVFGEQIYLAQTFLVNEQYRPRPFRQDLRGKAVSIAPFTTPNYLTGW